MSDQLPYDFDLVYDAKTVDELAVIYWRAKNTADGIEDLCESHGIDVPKDPWSINERGKKMDVVVRFPEGVSEQDALIVVRDAISNFIKLRAYSTVEAAVEREYEGHGDRFRADKVAGRKRRIEIAEAARVMSFNDAREVE